MSGYECIPPVPTDMRQPDQIELNIIRVEVGGNQNEDVNGEAGNGTVSIDTSVDSCESGLDFMFVDRKLENKDVGPSARSWGQKLGAPSPHQGHCG